MFSHNETASCNLINAHSMKLLKLKITPILCYYNNKPQRYRIDRIQ